MRKFFMDIVDRLDNAPTHITFSPHFGDCIRTLSASHPSAAFFFFFFYKH